MRLKYDILLQYNSLLEFWHNSCSYKSKPTYPREHCCNPETISYQKRCSEIWAEWHNAGGKGKLPVMPPPTVECEKCRYADLTLGRFQGNASLRIISRHVAGTIPVPLKGRKKIWLDNINQKQLESVLNDIDSDIEAFAISGSPTIKDFSFLERFPNLKKVYIWWNNKITNLWDMTKTPDIEFLYLDAINNLSDISQLKNAKKLRCLYLYGGKASINSLKPLENHPSLEFIFLCRIVTDSDMRSIITIPNLKYFYCLFNIFDIDAYAMFEAKRPDVDTSFWEGIYGYDDEQQANRYFVGLVGKRQGLVDSDNIIKLEKHRKKYLAIKQKYLMTE